MRTVSDPWDYLIVTASNDRQAAAYQSQLALRQSLGMFAGIGQVIVVPDLGGKRIGSGGSTILCLLEVLNRELAAGGLDAADPAAWEAALRRLRVLIIHAGGDSRRVPAYGPCGKIFVPVPGESDSAVGATLFDRQLPTYLDLPAMPAGAGQVVLTSGDVLLSFDPLGVEFAPAGWTGLGCLASPAEASRHGVFCPGPDGAVRLFLQKPSPQAQADYQAVNRYGQSVLDIGVASFDAATAVALLRMCDTTVARDGRLAWTGEMGRAIEECGLDVYREIACAMGTQASSMHLSAAARASGSRWSDALLGRVYQTLAGTSFRVQVVPQCGFLHFGTTRQLITSGLDLLRGGQGIARGEGCLELNNEPAAGAGVSGANSWVEGCRIGAKVDLDGWNVVVGLDIDEPLALPAGACLDVLSGKARDGRDVWFVRCCGVGDTFKDSLEAGATFCGLPVAQWLAAAGAAPHDVWDAATPAGERSLWNARVFPAAEAATGYRQWLWMFAPAGASDAQRRAWRQADRYSAAQIADLADPHAFHRRRGEIRAEEIRRSLRRMFGRDSRFSAAELAYTLRDAREPAACAAELIAEAQWYAGEGGSTARLEAFTACRILHTLGSAVAALAGGRDVSLNELLPGLAEACPPATRAWLAALGLPIAADTRAAPWADAAAGVAFRQLGGVIVSSGSRAAAPPVSALRSDEIVWGRCPARLDLGGGWSDTPPYSLEYGGCVINAAVDLNGQPPIHVYARLTEEPVIRISSIDLGHSIRVEELEELLNFRSATSEFGLAKAALAISGFSPSAAAWPAGITLRGMLEHFGGGIDLTTLAAIPKGSGLGTSSIVGAALLAVVQRTMGRTLSRQELFHGVLRLEQSLTTGGGWQDQVGGVVDGVKVTSAEPGLVPDTRIHYVPADVLDPAANGGATLLYYTGITRVAKNILQQVVGRYLNRDRQAMATLRQIHALPPHLADAMARKDLPAFGRLIDLAWRLNKQLDPNSSTPQIEAMLDRARPHIHGAKLLGAGGGGFLLLVCKSPADAVAARQNLQAHAPNERARFFDFGISRDGLVVTVC